MVKFSFKRKSGKIVMGFGINQDNVRRLKKGDPIFVDLSQFGIDGEILIFYGETEQDLVAFVSPHIDKETKVYSEGNNDRPS